MNNETPSSPPDIERVLEGVSLDEAKGLREVWALAAELSPIQSDAEAVSHALERLESALGDPTEDVPALVSRRLRRRHTPSAGTGADREALRRANSRPRAQLIAGAAVVLLLLVGIGTVWLLRPVTMSAPSGGRLLLTLDDGSRVELNGGSSLQHARFPRNVRSVRLEGEAHFDVAQGEIPFVVSTFNAVVRVEGTRFTVRAWSGEATIGTTVALESGRIAFAPLADPSRWIVMAPGEARRVGYDTVAAVPQLLPDWSVDDASAWRRGDLVFKNQTVRDILADIERRFAVSITAHPALLLEKRMNLALRQPRDGEAVIQDLAAALGVRYRETSKGFELYVALP